MLIASPRKLKKDLRKLVIVLCAILSVTIAAHGQKASRSTSQKSPNATQNTAPNASTLLARITQITKSPIFKHSTLGVEVYDLTDHQTLVAINEQKLFTSGSTTKVITEGTALALLGENYRFHTRVYYTGNIAPDGTLEGDLVLVASGDPNLSGRIKPDETLDFTSFDHAYAGSLRGESVAGDPMLVFKDLASAIVAKGIWRITGNVLIDASLFPSNQVEPGTRTTISPVVLNDNVIDVIATSAFYIDGPVAIDVAPQFSFLKVINKARTGDPDSDAELQFTSDIAEADGSHTVVLEGNVPAGGNKAQAAYKIKDPVLFATIGFRAALRWANVVLDDPDPANTPASLADSPRTILAEHVSPPFKEEVKLTLKVSQNLHAATTPYLLGAILAHASTDAFQQGIDLEKQFLTKAGLDPESVSQLDGEGGIGSAFSPDFMVRYLDYMSRQPYARLFFDSLPVLGRDGTLAETMKDSPAAGHVHAKTGSYVVANPLNKGVMLLGKGLVGYVDAANGHRFIIVAYVNLVPLRNMEDVGDVGRMLSEIAGLVYRYASPAAVTPAKTPKRMPAATKAKGRPSVSDRRRH
jgi:D-alanyl-D-alanine carboxypeptidase/D-alanyl-D-alanine-endopeptidase (penicillin-binding protein 4)